MHTGLRVSAHPLPSSTCYSIFWKWFCRWHCCKILVYSQPWNQECLGIRVRKVWFSCFRIFPVLKNWSIACITLFLTISQFFWKKKALNPSGPGALSGFIWKTAVLISLISTFLSSYVLDSGMITLLTTNLGKLSNSLLDWKAAGRI